ncbi:MAG: class I SAM-dependent methyltransferase [Gemmatimonadetes bacterium]|nr:class I SAM-dependent methyltransferase [Gemmatimonadota bacterium]
MEQGFNYSSRHALTEAPDLSTAIRLSTLNCLHHQLGWSVEESEARARVEETRGIPRGLLNHLEASGWNTASARILDVGAGQGANLLKLLVRGADAYGVEPGAEFAALTRWRLVDMGFEPERLISAPGENLPFPDESFDYAISMQVLEHVRDPEPVLRQIFRVLKPGGKCYISCENYLTFREPEYRVAWLPLLPKRLGSLYLKLRGRDPEFFDKYIFYTTYPQIWRVRRRVGFMNQTFEPYLEMVRTPTRAARGLRPIAKLLHRLPEPAANAIVYGLAHTLKSFYSGVKFQLQKPER